MTAEGSPRPISSTPKTNGNLPIDPVNLLTPAIEVFLPVTAKTNNTLLGLWFDTTGDLQVYIQQAVVSGNIYSQVKIITARLPIAFGFTLFNLGLALWVTRSTIFGMRAVLAEAAQEFDTMLRQAIEKINEKVDLSQADLQEIEAALPGPKTPFDPVNLLAPVVEIFLPVTTSNENTMLGLWFDTEGLLQVYVQQAVIPANIYSQIKIATIRLPVALGNGIFFLGTTMFFTRSYILSNRAAVAEVAGEVKLLLKRIRNRIQQNPLRRGAHVFGNRL